MDDFKKSLAGAVGTVAKSSNRFLKTAKLSLSVSNEEMNLKQLYEEIGRKVREVYLLGGSLGAVFDAKNMEVAEQEAKISRLKDELNSMKGTKNCAACNTANPAEAGYCKKCGQRFGVYNTVTQQPQITDMGGPLERPSGPPATMTESAPVKESVKLRCQGCGALNEESEKFCLSCGRKV